MGFKCQDGPLLTVSELAGLLQVKPSWVYTKVAQDAIPHIKVGRYVRFEYERVMRWLQAEKTAEYNARAH